MAAEKKSPTFGWCIYGLGVMALGAVCVAFGDFHPGQPVPKDFPARAALAYAAALFMARSPVRPSCGGGRRPGAPRRSPFTSR
jgi:hypothetical protein